VEPTKRVALKIIQGEDDEEEEVKEEVVASKGIVSKVIQGEDEEVEKEGKEVSIKRVASVIIEGEDDEEEEKEDKRETVSASKPRSALVVGEEEDDDEEGEKEEERVEVIAGDTKREESSERNEFVVKQEEKGSEQGKKKEEVVVEKRKRRGTVDARSALLPATQLTDLERKIREKHDLLRKMLGTRIGRVYEQIIKELSLASVPLKNALAVTQDASKQIRTGNQDFQSLLQAMDACNTSCIVK